MVTEGAGWWPSFGLKQRKGGLDQRFCHEEAMLGGSLIGWPGDDLLSHRWACSTMGAEGFHGRVRNGVGWVTLAMITKPSDQG